MNAAPFYVMAIVVVFMEDQWDWNQAFGVALVGIAVLMAQPRKLFKLSTNRHHQIAPNDPLGTKNYLKFYFISISDAHKKIT